MSLRNPLAVLLRPADALDPIPSPDVGLRVVLLVGLVSGASLYATGLLFADAIDRSVIDLGTHAGNVITAWAVAAPVVFLLLWPTLAGAFHLLTGHDGTFEDVLSVTAWGFLPAIPVSLARPIYFAAVGVRVPAVGTPEAMNAVLREAVFAGALPLLAVSVCCLAWQAYVFGGGLQAAKGVSRRFGLVVAGSTLAVAALIGSVPRPGYIEFVFLLVFGAPALLFPRTLLRIDMNLALIGFRNTRDVEPEEWYVRLTRLGGVALFAFGLGAIGGFRYLV